MKFNLLFLLLFISIASNAQRLRLLKSGDKYGYETTDKKGKPKFKVSPQFENYFIHAKLELAGVDLGNSYIDALNWIDTEFVEVPINIEVPTKTETDTILYEWRIYNPENLILAKKAGKWGIIKASGEIVRLFEYDSILLFPHFFGSENGPLLVPFKDNKLSVVNQKNETILSTETMFKYYPYDGYKQYEALGITFFNDMLLVQEPNTFELIKDQVKGIGSSINEANDTNVYSYSYNYTYGIFRKGNFNVLLTKQNKLLFAKHQDQIWVQFFSPNDIKINMDVCSYSSINQASVYYKTKQVPNLQIKFVTQP